MIIFKGKGHVILQKIQSFYHKSDAKSFSSDYFFSKNALFFEKTVKPFGGPMIIFRGMALLTAKMNIIF